MQLNPSCARARGYPRAAGPRRCREMHAQQGLALSPRVATQGMQLPGAAALPCQVPSAARGFFPAPGPAGGAGAAGCRHGAPWGSPTRAGELALLLRFPRPHATSTHGNELAQGRGQHGPPHAAAPGSTARPAGAGLTAPAQRGLLSAPWLPARRLHRPVLPAHGGTREPGRDRRSLHPPRLCREERGTAAHRAPRARCPSSPTEPKQESGAARLRTYLGCPPLVGAVGVLAVQPLLFRRAPLVCG